MKILLVIPYFRNASAGTITYIENLVASLPDIKFVLIFIKTDNDINLEFKNLKIISLKETMVFGKQYGLTLRIKEIWKETRKVDLVHSHGLWMGLNIIIGLITFFSRKPHVISIHGFLTNWSRKNNFGRKIVSLVTGQLLSIRTASKIIFTNEFELLDAPFYIPRKKNVIIDNIPPVPKRALLHTEEVCFGFISRIHQKKNLISLLKIFSENKGFKKFLIAGPIEDEEYFKDCMEYISNDSRISYLGEVIGNAKSKFFQEISCLILPTKSENYGYVVPEALSYGRKVILSNNTPWKDDNELFGIEFFESEETLRDLMLNQDVLTTNTMVKIITAYTNYFNGNKATYDLKLLYKNVAGKSN